VNLNQVSLPSEDLRKACVFYRRLGLTQIVDALPRYARFECPALDSRCLYWAGPNRRFPPWRLR